MPESLMADTWAELAQSAHGIGVAKRPQEREMNAKYKETSEGGLAVPLVLC